MCHCHCPSKFLIPSSTFALSPKPYIKHQNKQHPFTHSASPYIKSVSISILQLPKHPLHRNHPTPPARHKSRRLSSHISCSFIVLPEHHPLPPIQPPTCPKHILRPQTRCSALAPVRPKTVTAALHPPPPPTPLPSQCSRLCLPEDSHRGLPFPSLPSTSTTKTTKEMGLDQSGRTRESHSFASAPKSPTDFVPAGHCLFFFQVFLVPKVPRRPPSTPLERFLF